MTDETQAATIAFLADPATHGGAPVQRIDTHGAIVFLAGDRAYKLKRAVRFDYMDFSTVEKRRAMCDAELSINRRTAPDLYLAVVPVTEERQGLALAGRGAVRDWVVVMRRFDNTLLFDRMAREGRLTAGMMREVAAEVLRFQSAAAVHRRPDPVGHLRGLVEMAVAELRRHVPSVFPAAKVDSLAVELLDRLTSAAPLIVARSEAGHVRRLHGDLHLRNICQHRGRATLFDAIEFNDDIAIGDRLYDVAFLLMDLLHHKLAPLANHLLNAWLAEPDDDAGLRLLPLFMALRAAIRAHVSVSMARTMTAAMRREQASEAGGYLDLALRLVAPAAPCLLAVGGYSGTGKSTLARALAPEMGQAPGAVLLRSDEVRKALFGIPATERLPPEAYNSEVSQRVYQTLYRRATALLQAGQSVIADALFSRPADRLAIETVARQEGVAFRGLWLDAPFEILAARVAARRNDASDATLDVLKRQMATPPGPVAWYTLDASLRPDDVLKQALVASS